LEALTVFASFEERTERFFRMACAADPTKLVPDLGGFETPACVVRELLVQSQEISMGFVSFDWECDGLLFQSGSVNRNRHAFSMIRNVIDEVSGRPSSEQGDGGQVFPSF